MKTMALPGVILLVLGTGCQSTHATVRVAPTIIHSPVEALAVTEPEAEHVEAPAPKDVDTAAVDKGEAGEKADSPGDKETRVMAAGLPKPAPAVSLPPSPLFVVVNISTDKHIPVTTTAAGGIGDEASSGFWATAKNWLGNALPFAMGAAAGR